MEIPAISGPLAAMASRILELQIGDAFVQYGHEVTHDVRDGLLHTEEIGVEVALGNSVADLPREAGVQLVFRHGFENRATEVSVRMFRSHAMFAVSGRWKLCEPAPTAI
jgi:hypothetical protein